MALAEVQTALARLFTEADARAEFTRDPHSAGRRLGLDDSDAQALAVLAPQPIEAFARSLYAKRALDARKLIPATALALGEGFTSRLSATFEGPPRGAAADALALVASLSKGSEASTPWLGDVARYEGAFVEMGRRRFGLCVRRFRYHAPAIAAALRRGEAVGSTAQGAALGLWARAPGGRLRCWFWPRGGHIGEAQSTSPSGAAIRRGAHIAPPRRKV